MVPWMLTLRVRPLVQIRRILLAFEKLSVCMSASHPKATALTILPEASCQGFRVLSLGIVADAPLLELSLPTSRKW